MLKESNVSGFLCAIAAVLSSFVFAGCDQDFVGGESATEVAGQVLLDGQPVADARVVFIPFRLNGPTDQKHEMAFATTDAEGNFTLVRANGEPGVCRGLHRVMISKRKTDDKEAGRLESADWSLLTDSQGELRQPDDELIPVIYNLHSTLTFTVESALGLVRADFELSSVDPLLKK